MYLVTSLGRECLVLCASDTQRYVHVLWIVELQCSGSVPSVVQCERAVCSVSVLWIVSVCSVSVQCQCAVSVCSVSVQCQCAVSVCSVSVQC